MRTDGSLEDWDERFLPSYQELSRSINPRTGTPHRQRRDRGARIADLWVMVQDRLKAYQSYFVKTGSFRGLFQFARYISEGDNIRNLTTGDVYTVKRLVTGHDGEFLGEVILSGGTDPEETDRLRLDTKNMIVASHAHPRSEVSASSYDDESDTTDRPALFNDTVEFSIRRTEPGTVGKRPFDRERQALPLLREPNLDEVVDPSYGVDTYGWWFDHIVQFDLFTRNNERLYGTAAVDGGGDPGLIAWFQDFMMRYRWVFIWNGVQQLLEWQGTEDKPVGNVRNDMVHRPLLWYARTERVSFARIRRIEQIDVLVSIGAPQELSAQTGCPVPTGQVDITVNDLGLYNQLGGL